MIVRVVLADDQRVVRDGLVLLLRHMPDIEVVAAVGDGAAAVAAVQEHRPEVVLMDLRMPGMDGVEATSRITAEYPDVRVLVLTTFDDDESIFSALRAGARGYLTKDAGAADIARAVHHVATGDAALDPSVQAKLIDSLRTGPLPAGRPEAEHPDQLTAREREVLTLIADGLSNGEIARALVVSEATVKTHVNRLFAKTGVRDRAQAVAYAYRRGIARP